MRPRDPATPRPRARPPAAAAASIATSAPRGAPTDQLGRSLFHRITPTRPPRAAPSLRRPCKHTPRGSTVTSQAVQTSAMTSPARRLVTAGPSRAAGRPPFLRPCTARPRGALLSRCGRPRRAALGFSLPAAPACPLVAPGDRLRTLSLQLLRPSITSQISQLPAFPHCWFQLLTPNSKQPLC